MKYLKQWITITEFENKYYVMTFRNKYLAKLDDSYSEQRCNKIQKIKIQSSSFFWYEI